MIDFYYLEMFCKTLGTIFIYTLFEMIQEISYDRLEGKNMLSFLATKYKECVWYCGSCCGCGLKKIVL